MMLGEISRYRFEDAFFVECPRGGRFELVTFVIHDIEQIDENGRYARHSGRAGSGRIYFGLDKRTNQYCYHQYPPESVEPGGTFVLVAGAAVYKNWAQLPRSDLGINCIE